MAGEDEDTPGRDAAGPDLELPSLFRRRKDKRGRRGRDEPTSTSGATEELPVTAAPVGADAPTQPLRPVPGATRRPPPAAPPTSRPSAEPLAEEPVAEEPVEEPVAPAAPPAAEAPRGGTDGRTPAVPQEQPVRPPRPTGPPPRPRRRGPEMTWSGPQPEAPTPTAPVGQPAGRVAVAEAPAGTTGTTGTTEPDEQPAARGRRVPRPSLPSIDLRVPDLSPRLAAAVTGVAVALSGIVLVWLSLQACTTVRGVSSCGGIGLLAIVLTLVAQGAVGTILLGVLGVAQQRSTAVLGVGVASFVAMVLLYASLSGPWLSAALLLVTPAAFVLAEGVTSGRFSDSS